MKSCLEKLTVAFSLGASSAGTTVIGDREFERLTFDNNVSNERIFSKIAAVWPGLSLEQKFTKTDGGTISVSTLAERLRKGESWGGPLQFGGLKLQVAELPAVALTIITVEETIPGSAGQWDDWIEPLLVEEDFVQGWIADVVYDYWQNASDPLEYEAVGKSYIGLPLKSNGLPFPLEQNMIDVSHNPGRTEIKDGYVEAIGVKMWIGQKFWAIVGNKPTLPDHSLDGFRISSSDTGVMYFSIEENSFNSEETSGMQQLLRKILYGVDGLRL